MGVGRFVGSSLTLLRVAISGVTTSAYEVIHLLQAAH